MEQMQSLQRFQKDSEWFYQNTDKLRKQGFTGKFVAIKDSELVASGKTAQEIMKKLDKKKENPSFIFIEFVHPEGFTLIL